MPATSRLLVLLLPALALSVDPANAATPAVLIHLDGTSFECAEYTTPFPGSRYCVRGLFVERSVHIFKNRDLDDVTTRQPTVSDGTGQTPQTVIREGRLSIAAFVELQRVLAAKDVAHRWGHCNPWPGRPTADDPQYAQTWRLSWFGPPPHRPWISSPFGTDFGAARCAPNLLEVFNAVLAAAETLPPLDD